MDILETSIYKIDFDLSNTEKIETTKLHNDFDKYLKGLLKIVADRDTGREYYFDRSTTEVKSIIDNFLKGEVSFLALSEIISSRLLICEKAAQQKIAHIGNIQKGIVVVSLMEDGENKQFVICKAEHNEFLADTSFVITKGLPIKKKIYKAFICKINSNVEVLDVLVFDTNNTISAYWWKDFLELTEVYDDVHNTKNAFEALDKAIFSKMKKDHPQDYVFLRNSTVRYFRANNTFNMDEYLTNAIGDYQPYSTNLDIGQLKTKIKELPAKKKFDTQFTIVKKHITAKFLTKIPLTSEIDLVLKEDVPRLQNTIIAEIGSDGTHYVKIRSEQGYNYFKGLNRQDNEDTNPNPNIQ